MCDCLLLFAVGEEGSITVGTILFDAAPSDVEDSIVNVGAISFDAAPTDAFVLEVLDD